MKNIIFTKCILIGKSESELKEIEIQLKDFQNPSKDKIYYYFNSILGIKLQDDNFDNNYFTSLGQIVSDRHRIAHSDPLLGTIQHLKSLNDVKKHYIEIQKFISKLCELTSC
ncbi:MAG: HEPN domain-containing protein [Candidatus Methanoperedens sp.]